MNPIIYKIIHLAAVVTLFASFGAAIYTASSKENKLATILHGISLLLLFVSGFGLVAKIWDNNWSWWIIAKLVIWLILGGSYGLVKKRLLPENTAFAIVIILGIVAVVLGNVAYLGG